MEREYTEEKCEKSTTTANGLPNLPKVKVRSTQNKTENCEISRENSKLGIRRSRKTTSSKAIKELDPEDQEK